MSIARCLQFLRQPKLRATRKIVVAVVGGTVVLVGIAMTVLPGPAFLVIPAGLAILATEFLWAQRWLAKARALLPRGAKPPRPGAGNQDHRLPQPGNTPSPATVPKIILAAVRPRIDDPDAPPAKLPRR
jgi:hypothetical protein